MNEIKKDEEKNTVGENGEIEPIAQDERSEVDITEKHDRKLTPKWFLPDFWVKNIRLAPDGQKQIDELGKSAAIVHIFEHFSRTDLAWLYWTYHSHKLTPPARITEKIRGEGSKIEQVPSPGRPKAILLGKNESMDRIAELIALARKTAYPIILVPQVIVYERKPDKAGDSIWWDNLAAPGGKPKIIRKWWSMFRSNGKAIIAAAEPINLKEWIAKPEISSMTDNAAARALVDKLRYIFREERRVVIGPNLPHREKLKRRIKQHPTITRAVSEEARKAKKSEWEIWNEVDIHLDEIMADFNIGYIKMWEKVLSWVWKKFFMGVVVDMIGLERTRRAVRKSPVIYVPCHRSHTDYLLLSYVLFTHDMIPPHIAAGRNLNFWPLGHIFRKSGAFFMRRSFKNTGIYTAVFETYIRSILKEGFNIEFFIEGGRSRTGKMFLPKMGVLGMFINAFEENELQDLSFVPISIAYDRVPEEDELLRDTQAAKKEKSSSIKMVRELLRKNFGRIHVNFAPPISMKEFLAERSAEPKKMDEESLKALYRDFAFRVIYAMNEVSVISPAHLMNAALLARNAPGVEENKSIDDAMVFLKYLDATGARLAPTLRNPRPAFAEALNMTRSSGDIEEVSIPDADDDDEVLTLKPDKRPNLEYYKNGAMHKLYAPAFVACSLLSQQNEKILRHYIESDFEMMSNLFKYEFVFRHDWQSNSEVKDILGVFQKCGYVTGNGEGEADDEYLSVTEDGKAALPLFTGLVENFIEAYLFAIENIGNIFGANNLAQKDFEKRMVKAAFKAFHTGQIKRRETISTVTFANAMSMAVHLGIISIAEKTPDGKATWKPCDPKHFQFDEYTEKLKRWSKASYFSNT